ncbi:MAG: hypothetical protein IAF02_27895, partial [Anaerolineae bacterium]|nr:hypothetical protein [Anaerolineae bacterium]
MIRFKHVALAFIILITLSACQFPVSDPISVPPTSVVPVVLLPTAEATLQPVLVPTAIATLPPPQTAVPLPTPIYNPDLAEWTILVYMAADNNLELSALRDLNEMEAA